jgi:hypothetical protein
MAEFRIVRVASAAILVLAAAACGTPQSKQSSSPAAGAPKADASAKVLPEHLPWTREFQEPALLVATEVRVEGPVGLLAHIATRIDPEVHERVEKTVPAGFLQQVTVKSDAGEAEIKAQLDNLSVVALRRLIVIEQPGPHDVVVTARGQAWWSNVATKAEQRAELLTLVGKIER